MERAFEDDTQWEDLSEPIVLQGRPPDRVILYWARGITGAAVGFIGTGVFVDHVLGMAPGAHMTLLLVAAAAGLLVNVLRPKDFGIRRIEIEDGMLYLAGPSRHVELPAKEVDAVVGCRQVSLDGGELLVWKTLRLAAGGERYAFHVAPKDAPGHFQELLEHCPNAVGIDAEPSVVLPAKAAGVRLREWLDDLRGQARPALAEMVRRYALGCVATFLAGCLLAVMFVVRLFSGPMSDGAAKSLMYPVIALALALLYAVCTLQGLRAFRRSMVKLDRIEIDGEWTDQDAIARIKLRAPVRPVGSGSLLAKLLTLASLVLFLVPGVGLVVSGIAWLGLGRSTSGLAVLAKTLLILSVAISAAFGIILLLDQLSLP